MDFNSYDKAFRRRKIDIPTYKIGVWSTVITA